MKVVVPSGILERMRRHGEETYPHECCGFMLGSAEDGLQRIVEIRGQANERTESRENRFLITPDQFKSAESAARKAGLQLVGIYHSHPDCDAYFSSTDLENSCGWLSFVVISIRKGEFSHARRPEQEQGMGQAVELVDQPGPGLFL